MAIKKKKVVNSTKKKSSVLAISLKTLLNIILVILFILSLLIIPFSIAYLKNPPETVKTAYADTLTYAQEDKNGDKPYPIEVNVFTNERNNGMPCYEIRLNYYTDANIPEVEEDYKNVYSSGFQCLEKVRTKDKLTTNYISYALNSTEIVSPCFYYNSVFGESYKAINELDYSDKWIFDYGAGHGLMLVSSMGDKLVSQFLWEKAYQRIGINDFIKAIFEIVELMDDGVYILPFDVSEYFNYKIYDTEQKKFIDEQADNKWLFFQMKLTKSSNGLVSSNQSLFGQIANNSHYGYDGISNADYYRSMTVYNLTEDDFYLKQSIVNGQTYNLATIKTSVRDYLKSFSRMYIRVLFDLDNLKFDNLGFSSDAFGDVAVNDVIVSSLTEKTFYNFSNKQLNLNGNITVLTGGDLNV